VRPHFRFGSEIWNWSENFVSLGSEKKAWFHRIHFDAKHQKSEAKTKVKYAKIKWKNRRETKIKQKKRKKSEKVKKSGKSEKIYLNFASLCFASKQKVLNRSEAKNLKWKKVKKSEKSEKMQKNAKNSEKKWKKVKRSEIIDLHIASLCFASKRKLLKWSEAKNYKRK
jgi:hypothetical protein